ncbi:MAG: superoxide dismutase family protein [Novosphingobium sp.]
MSYFRKASSALCVLALSASPLAAKAPAGPSASAPLFTASGTDAGYAVIVNQRGKAMLRISLSGLTPGEHGMHFHAVGSCKGAGFTGAGGHLNPEGKMHGTKNPAGSHLGDLPNVTADASGLVLANIPLAGPASKLLAAIFDTDGTAIVVHAAADDYMTDPSGNSGGRIACGVFKAN